MDDDDPATAEQAVGAAEPRDARRGRGRPWRVGAASAVPLAAG
jgi:hypothetical protein